MRAVQLEGMIQKVKPQIDIQVTAFGMGKAPSHWGRCCVLSAEPGDAIPVEFPQMVTGRRREGEIDGLHRRPKDPEVHNLPEVATSQRERIVSPGSRQRLTRCVTAENSAIWS